MTAPIDVTGIRLETDRLILRPWEPADLDDFFTYTGDEKLVPGMGWKQVETREEAEACLNDSIFKKESLAIVRKDTGRVIGDISIQARNWAVYPISPELMGRELGFGIGSEHWGQGFMPEVVRCVLDYCFRTLRYDFLTCGHFRENNQSKRVIRKCGFQHLFDDRRTIPKTGRTYDLSTYILYNPHKEG